MKKSVRRVLALLLTAALLFGCCWSASAATVDTEGKLTRIASVMNGDTETSRGISWATEEKTDSIVLVSENEDMSGAVEYTGSATIFNGYYMHKVVVDHLEAGKTYYYTVGDSALRSRVCSFTTDPGRGNAISFLAFADVQASSRENFQQAASVVKAGYELFPDVDFSVNLGDYVNDCTNDEWNWYFEEFAFLNDSVSMAPVAGNHEGNLKWFWFDSMFNIGKAEGSASTTGCYYSFDYGDAHIAVLNTNDMYPMSEQQINWLKNDMNATDATWKIVMLHRSLYSAGKHTNKPDSAIMRNMLLPVIDELDIDLVLGGHEHMYLRTYPVSGEGNVDEDCTYITELVDGVETTFAVDPAGTVHVMPSTAGTKRYEVNDNALDYITDAAAKIDTTRDKGGIVTNISIDGGKLVYQAYLVDDDTGEVTLYDSFGIQKSTTGAVNEGWEDLPTDAESNLAANIRNLFWKLLWLVQFYLTEVLPQLFR